MKHKWLFLIVILLMLSVGIVYYFIYNKKDITSPIVEVHSIDTFIDGYIPNKEDFITSIKDDSPYIIEDIDIKKVVGKQEIDITVIDTYGNKTTKKAILNIKEHQKNIIFKGLNPIAIEVGNTINLKENVVVIDEDLNLVEYKIDDSSVIYNKPGKYEIKYIAKDNLNNEIVKIREITIKEIPKTEPIIKGTPKKETNITYMINNFPTYNQYPNYPNGCESIALYNLLRYYNVIVTPEEIINTLKKGVGPYWESNVLYGGNPEIEFVSDPRKNNGYGVYELPIIEVANHFKKGIINYTGHSLNNVLELVKNNIPVQVWVSINLKDTKVCASWTYKQTGKKIDWICDLHSVIIIGFNKENIYVSDSITGKIESYNRNQFEKMFNLFGKRAIYYNN